MLLQGEVTSSPGLTFAGRRDVVLNEPDVSLVLKGIVYQRTLADYLRHRALACGERLQELLFNSNELTEEEGMQAFSLSIEIMDIEKKLFEIGQ
jgi:hypothetical protein